jgi:hypothetical protein
VGPPGARPLEIIVTNDNNSNPSPDEERNPPSPHRPPTDDRIRLYLMFVVSTLVAVLALSAVVQPTAGPVLDKVLPLLALVVGYFFGQGRR